MINSCSLEWKLYYLEVYMEELEKIIEMTERTIFFAPPSPKPVQNTNNLHIIPLYKDEDIFVPDNSSIIEIFKNKK